MVVGMNRCLTPERLASDLTAAVGDHLVYVHVELGAAAGHPHMQGEHVMMLASEDFVTGLSDEFVLLIAQALTGMVGCRGGFLQNGVSGDHFTRNQVLADAEMLERALCLRTPELIRWHFNHAQAICFLSHIAHSDFSLSFGQKFHLCSNPRTAVCLVSAYVRTP